MGEREKVIDVMYSAAHDKTRASGELIINSSNR